jgi:hypothetical protein
MDLKPKRECLKVAQMLSMDKSFFTIYKLKISLSLALGSTTFRSIGFKNIQKISVKRHMNIDEF